MRLPVPADSVVGDRPARISGPRNVFCPVFPGFMRGLCECADSSALDWLEAVASVRFLVSVSGKRKHCATAEFMEIGNHKPIS
jgi:hypothetical protein